MKILYYSSHPNLALHSPTGYGTHMREMIGAFRRAGHEVIPVIMGGDGKQLPANERPPANLVKKFFRGIVPSFAWESMKDYLLMNKDLAYESYLREKIANVEPDLVYERASYLQLSGIQATKKYGIPHILEMNAPYVEERKEHFGISSFFEHRALSCERQQLSQSDCVITVSHALKTHFTKKHKLLPDGFNVLPNAVDPGKVNADPESVAEIKKEYGLKSQIVVGFVGSLFKWHGVDQLIRSVKILRDTGFDVALLIVGSGVILPELKKLSKTLALADHVFFTGNVPHSHVFDYISAMDITVLAASHWYGSPVKLFEYGAMKKPVIAPANGPVQEVMVPEEDGLLVEHEFDLVRQIRRLIERPELRSRLANSFYDKVLRDHTWDRNAERVLEMAGMLTPHTSF